MYSYDHGKCFSHICEILLAKVGHNSTFCSCCTGAVKKYMMIRISNDKCLMIIRIHHTLGLRSFHVLKKRWTNMVMEKEISRNALAYRVSLLYTFLPIYHTYLTVIYYRIFVIEMFVVGQSWQRCVVYIVQQTGSSTRSMELSNGKLQSLTGNIVYYLTFRFVSNCNTSMLALVKLYARSNLIIVLNIMCYSRGEYILYFNGDGVSATILKSFELKLVLFLSFCLLNETESPLGK